MRKKFNLKSTILGIVIGGIIFGGIGVLATNYLLKAEDVEYVDKDNNLTTVQSAITDLYNKAKNVGNEDLVIGEAVLKGNSITIPYMGTNYLSVNCIYGISKNYGSKGTIKDGNCKMIGLEPNTEYNYKIIATDVNGKIYEISGKESTTSISAPTGTTKNLPTGVKAIVYLDPTDLTNGCIESNSISTPETKTGCMKWYAYKLEDDKYTMILDHNTHEASTRSESWSNVFIELPNSVGWLNSLDVRMITVTEIAAITGKTGWKANDFYSRFFLDTNSSTRNEDIDAVGESHYAWLFDYTNGCTPFGCNMDGGMAKGYWTSDKYPTTGNYWYVGSNGLVGLPSNSNDGGTRPVITVDKSIIIMDE